VPELGRSPMKSIRIVACVVLLGFVCGCGESHDVSRLQEDEVTAADVAWATDTTIFKWKLRELNAKPIYSVRMVVLGPTNEVLAAGPWLTGGKSAFSYYPGELSLAMRNPESGPDLILKLRCNGQSTWWHLREEFKVHASAPPSPRPANTPESNILVVAVQATEKAGVPSSPNDWLNSRCKKLCLKLFTEPTSTGEPDGSVNGSQPIRSETNATPPAAGSRR